MTMFVRIKRSSCWVTAGMFFFGTLFLSITGTQNMSFASGLEEVKVITLDASNRFGQGTNKPEEVVDSIFDNMTVELSGGGGVQDAGIGYLSLSDGTQNMKPFIWVPNADDNSVSKIHTQTGAEVGRYKVSGGDASPSRTTVDLYGNCYVLNRKTGTVVKIGNVDEGIPGISYLDRNGNGVVDTSRPLPNGTASVLPWGEDEAVLFEVMLFPTSASPGKPTHTYRENLKQNQQYDNYVRDIKPRGAAVDRDNNVWIATWAPKTMYYISGLDGTVLASFNAGHSSYGMIIDGSNADFDYLWSTQGAGGSFVFRHKIDRKKLLGGEPNFLVETRSFNQGNTLYTVALDKILNPSNPALERDLVLSAPWGSHTFRAMVQQSPGSAVFNNIHITLPGQHGRGIQTDRFGSIWHAQTHDLFIARMRYDETGTVSNPHGRLLVEQSIYTADILGRFLRRNNGGVPVALSTRQGQPFGLSMDQEGNVWAIMGQDFKMRIKPNSSGNVSTVIDPTVHPTRYNDHISIFKGNSNGIQYAYSDMTGSVVNRFNNANGRWTVILDGQDTNAIFDGLTLDKDLQGGSLEIQIRTSKDRVTWSSPIIFQNEVGEKGLLESYRNKELAKGRFVMITMNVRRANVMAPSPVIRSMNLYQGVPVQLIFSEDGIYNYMLVDTLDVVEMTPDGVEITKTLKVFGSEVEILYNPQQPSLGGLTWTVMDQIPTGGVEILDTDKVNVKRFKFSDEVLSRPQIRVKVVSDDYDAETGKHYETWVIISFRADFQ
jgi:hypothetical protein